MSKKIVIWATTAVLFDGLLWAFLNYPPVDSAGAAAWVQAVGSVAAIYGAIWISTEGERQRRRESNAASKVTAYVVGTRLVEVRHMLATLKSEVDLAKVGPSRPNFDRLRHIVEQARLPNEAQMLRLAIAPEASDALARLLSCVALIEVTLTELMTDKNGKEHDTNLSVIAGLCDEGRHYEQLARRKLFEHSARQ